MLQGNKAGWSEHLSGNYLTEGGISCWSFVYDLCMCFDFYFHFKFSLHKWLHFVHTFVISLLHGVLSTYYIYVDYIEVAQCIIYHMLLYHGV